ncbi:MAG: peptidoglycan DD-metalloendopeptidase family protein [Prevotellaceae bacterium]|nr:peptidoglycan DD-metalloendopeptidase family protein [Prevotellaceae bacterium]
MPTRAQSNALIKELESKRGTLQKQINESERLLSTTKKNVSSRLGALSTLSGQIEERRRYLHRLSSDLLVVNRELTTLQRQYNQLQAELTLKKKRYEASVQFLYKHRSIQDKLLFILSANTLAQTYRRLRYVREYADFQRMQGEEIVEKQHEVQRKQTELEQVKSAKATLLKTREAEQQKLEGEEKEQRALVDVLRRQQRSLQQEINKQRREAQQLNNRIDRLVAEEIEKARRRAAEEARKEAKTTKSPDAPKGKMPVAPLETFTLNKADRELSGTFLSNRGRLPVPITGTYLITSHYGQYLVAGLRNVKLDNKGIDIQGRPGAQARAIFNGKVAAVFKLNGLYNILIRHGNYISVYCNLSVATVKQGDTVTTRQSLGTIFSDATDNNRTVLHFQLRKEKEKLNPELWIER